MKKFNTRLTSLLLSILMVLGIFFCLTITQVNAVEAPADTPAAPAETTSAPAETTTPTTTPPPTTTPSTTSATATKSAYTILEDGTAEITGYRDYGKVTELEIPSEIDGYVVTSIGERAFKWCSSLTLVTIPNSVTSIGDYAFNDCSSLTSVTIPNSVTSIGDYAFNMCSSLTSITIPDSVTSIGERAIALCENLTSINIGDSVTSISESAFASCSSLTSINVSANNQNYCSIDGVLFNKSATELVTYPCGKIGEYQIPNGVPQLVIVCLNIA